MANASKAKLEYIKRWKAENVRAFKFECNLQEDADIVAFLDAEAARGISKAATIKAAIREYMRID